MQMVQQAQYSISGGVQQLRLLSQMQEQLGTQMPEMRQLSKWFLPNIRQDPE